MTKLDYIVFYIVFIVIVTAFGTWLGISHTTGLGNIPSVNLSTFSFADVIPFFGAMLTFSIPDAGILSLVFYILSAIFLWCLAELVRGN